jgi:IclR family acetate operon transcriptional repressor
MARWLTVLEAFAAHPEWGIRDLAAETRLSRSSIHRIVAEMTSLGLLAPAPSAGRSEVGPALTRLALELTDRVDVTRIARPVLDDLRDAISETAILTLYDRGRRRFRAVTAAESSHPIRYIWESLQDWNDIHLGASGIGILAFLPPEEQRAIVDALPDPIGGPQRTSRRDLRLLLEASAQDGYVVSHGGRFAGAVGVCAPIRDAAGRVVGGVLMGWPDNRTDAAKERRAAEAAVIAARRISAGLGYTVSDESGAPTSAG